MDWLLTVRGDAVVGPNAPMTGAVPYSVFALTPTTAFVLPGIAGTEAGVGAAGSNSPTRRRFS